MTRPPKDDDPVFLPPCQWARWLMRSGDFVVFDSETTGLEGDAAFVQLAVVDQDGAVLFDSLINPGKRIPADAIAIHGITDDMVKDAPKFPDVFPQIRRALIDRRWLVYNAEFDTRILMQDCDRYGLLYPTPAQFRYDSKYAVGQRDDVWCAMLQYAEHYGDWSSYHQSYKWQSLATACRVERIKKGKAHQAMSDTLATLKLIQKLAWKEDLVHKTEDDNEYEA